MADQDRGIDQVDARQLGNLELLARQVVEGFITGLHKSPFHGFSVEFAEHRLYNTGESTKHIDWKLFGRTEKLFVKRYEEETNLRCHIVIDNSSSMHFPELDTKRKMHNKLQFSVHCAASIIHLMKKQRDAVGLSIFSDTIDLHTKARSSTLHHKMLFHEMEKLILNQVTGSNKGTSAASALHQIAENIHQRSLVIIFSDMMENSDADADELFSSLQHLRHNKHEVILFHVVDKKKEILFEYDNRPYLFIDMETGEKVKVHSNEVKQSYLESMTKYKKELILKCGQFRIDFVEADINLGYKQVLMPYLIKREKLH
jgi:uncharacterized protein (DUF58 family)